MAAKCYAVIHLCRVRATRLDATGAPEAGPNNVYITDKPVNLGATPVTVAGQDLDLLTGCNCVVASYRSDDKLKRFDLELDLATLEPGLLEMLTGGDAILDGGGFPIGLHFPIGVDCSVAQANVAIEAWQELRDGDAPAPSPSRYLRWIWPATSWTYGAVTLGNEFMQPKLTGFSRGNSLWGEGPFDDQPEAVTGPAVWMTDEIPDAACGYQSFAVT
jgi:hypothetical protein